MNPNFSIIWSTRQISHKQMQMHIASCVKRLKGMGLKEGERVAICEENTVEYVILLLSLWTMRLVAVPINYRWPPKMINEYTAKLNIAHIFKGMDLKHIVCFDARHDVEVNKAHDFCLEQDATIIATSGSSGEPKAALHTWGNHYYSAKGSNEIIPLTKEDRWLLSLPLYHVAGIGALVRCLISGASVAIVVDGEIMKAIEQGKVSHLSLVSPQLQRLLADEKNHTLLKKLKCILLGGSAIPISLVEQATGLGLNIYLSYGLTEMSSQVATGQCHCEKRSDEAISCVKVLPYRQLTIAPDGEILVQGETLFKGYVQGAKVVRPSVIASEAKQSNFWFPTGDLGHLDANGCLTVTGRKDNMFISGGENIQPEEIERVLLSFKGIEEAIVVPQADKEFGARPIAYIKCHCEPKGRSNLTIPNLQEHLQSHLPKFKIPIAIHPWPQELITQGMKINRQSILKRM